MNADDLVRQVLGILDNRDRVEMINRILLNRPPTDPIRQGIEQLLELARARRDRT